MYVWNAVEIVVWKNLSQPQCVDQNFDGHRNVGGHTSKFYRLHGARTSADSVMIKFVYRICTALAREGYFDKSYHKYYKSANKIISVLFTVIVLGVFFLYCVRNEKCAFALVEISSSPNTMDSQYVAVEYHTIFNTSILFRLRTSYGAVFFFFGVKDGEISRVHGIAKTHVRACITHAVYISNTYLRCIIFMSRYKRQNVVLVWMGHTLALKSLKKWN